MNTPEFGNACFPICFSRANPLDTQDLPSSRCEPLRRETSSPVLQSESGDMHSPTTNRQSGGGTPTRPVSTCGDPAAVSPRGKSEERTEIVLLFHTLTGKNEPKMILRTARNSASRPLPRGIPSICPLNDTEPSARCVMLHVSSSPGVNQTRPLEAP